MLVSTDVFVLHYGPLTTPSTRSRAPVLFNPETDECSIWLPFQDLHVHNLQKLVQKVNPNLLLVSLDLRGNNLQHEHAGQLGILMQRNRHLQRLDVGNNSLGACRSHRSSLTEECVLSFFRSLER